MRALPLLLAARVHALVDERIQNGDDHNGDGVDDVQEGLGYARQIADVGLQLDVADGVVLGQGGCRAVGLVGHVGLDFLGNAFHFGTQRWYDAEQDACQDDDCDEEFGAG